MKRLFSSLLGCALPLLALAQAPSTVQVDDSVGTELPFEVVRDSAFRPLNLDAVTSGILAERAFPLVDLSRFAGVTGAADTADYGTFGRVYYALRDGGAQLFSSQNTRQ